MPDQPTPAEGRAPEVPDKLLDLAWRAELARRAPGVSAEVIEEYCDFELHPSMRSEREKLRPILTAALPAHARQVRAQVAAEQRAAAQAIETSRGEDLDPLAAAIYDGCERDPEVPAMRDDCRNIAIVAYRHLADRIAQGEPDGARLALITADDLAEILDYVVGDGDVRVVRNETLDRAFVALKATLPRGEVR